MSLIVIVIIQMPVMATSKISRYKLLFQRSQIFGTLLFYTECAQILLDLLTYKVEVGNVTL